MIRMVPFELSHMDTLKPDPNVHGLENHGWVKKIPGNSSYMAATFLKDGEVLGVVGFYSPVKGTAKCWAILSEEIKKYPAHLFRSVKYCIAKIIEMGVIKIFEADILRGNKSLQRWITALGFSKEYELGRHDVFVRRV